MSRSADRLQLEPGEHSKNRCRNCGSHVTEQFRRGYSGNDDVLYHCTNCENPEICERDMMSGAGMMPDYDPAIHRKRHAASDRNPIFGGRTEADSR